MPAVRSPRLRARYPGSVAVALVVGAAVRMGWALWATATPYNFLNEGFQNLAMARAFAGRSTPMAGGEPTAFLAPGFALLISPLAWINGRLGWLATESGAAALNVAIGTATIALAAALAGRSLGPAARGPTAWLVALWPGHVYLSSVASGEILFVALGLAVLLVAYGPTQGDGRDATIRTATWLRLVAVGALVGLAMLVRASGMLLVVPAVLALRWTGVGVGRRAAAVAGTVLVVLAPWAVRNVIEVGVWTPTQTAAAVAACMGHSDGADGEVVGQDPIAEHPGCFRSRIFRDETSLVPATGAEAVGDRSEAAWYRRTLATAMGWAFTHPVDELELTVRKVFLTVSDGHGPLTLANDRGDQPLGTTRTVELLARLADGWQAVVLAFAGLGLALVPRLRAATPLWVSSALFAIPIVAALPSHTSSLTVFAPAAVLAGGFVAAARPIRATDGSDGGTRGASTTTGLDARPLP